MKSQIPGPRVVMKRHRELSTRRPPIQNLIITIVVALFTFQLLLILANFMVLSGIIDDNNLIHTAIFHNRKSRTSIQSNQWSLEHRCAHLLHLKPIQPHNLLFIHIPKTAGMSISHILGLLPVHNTSSELRECEPQLYDLAMSFTVIRHPFDRMISMYNYAKHGGLKDNKDLIKFGWAKYLNLDQFIEAVELEKEENVWYSSSLYFIGGLYDGGNHSLFEDLGRTNHDKNRVEDENDSKSEVFDMYPSFTLNETSYKLGVKRILCYDTLSHDWNRLIQDIDSAFRPAADPSGMHENIGSNETVGRVVSISHRSLDTIHRLWGYDFALWEQFCGGRSPFHSVKVV